MSVTKDSANKVKKNITSIYQRRRAAVYALSLDYAARALDDFRKRQPAGSGVTGEFWTNQSNQARDRVFSDAFIEQDVVGWFIAHGIEYGVYLELANDRQNEALAPIVKDWVKPFRADLKKIYGAK